MPIAVSSIHCLPASAQAPHSPRRFPGGTLRETASRTAWVVLGLWGSPDKEPSAPVVPTCLWSPHTSCIRCLPLTTSVTLRGSCPVFSPHLSHITLSISSCSGRPEARGPSGSLHMLPRGLESLPPCEHLAAPSLSTSDLPVCPTQPPRTGSHAPCFAASALSSPR